MTAVSVRREWAQFGPGAVGVGWDLALVGLARHMSGGEPMGPQQGAAWVGSAEGREFISLSSEQWWQASIAAGTPVAEAQAPPIGPSPSTPEPGRRPSPDVPSRAHSGSPRWL